MKKTVRKSLLSVLSALFVAVLAIFFVACTKTRTDKYTLTFETNGGTQIAAITAEAGAEITPPADPEKTGYTFDGWYLNEDFSGSKQKLPTTMPSNSITYYAKYTEIQYATLTLDATNYGTLETKTYQVAVGANVAEFLTGITPQGKDDAVFSCWYEGYQELANTKTMPKKGLTLTAKYTVSYTVKIYQQNTDGKDYTPLDDVKNGSGLVGDTIDFSDDYDFKNAYDNFNFNLSKTQALELSTEKGENVYAAYFDRKKVSVVYVSNAPSDATATATGTVEGESCMIGAEVTVTSEKFALEGYLFAGWSTEYEETGLGGKLYQSGDKLEVDSMGLTLYAQWNYGVKDAYNSTDGDIIYLLKETYDTETKSGKAIFSREGVGEKEIAFKVNESTGRTEFTITTDDGTILSGRISADGKTFAYKRTSAYYNTALKLYDYESQEIVAGVTIVLDGIDGATYTYIKDGETESTVVTGTYTLNSSDFTFTPDAAFTSESAFVFTYGTLTKGGESTLAFQKRDSYYGVYYSSTATSSNSYPLIIFDGYGNAYKYTSSSSVTQGSYEHLEGNNFNFTYEDSNGDEQTVLLLAGRTSSSSTQGIYYECDAVKGEYTYVFNSKNVTLTLNGFGTATYAVEGATAEEVSYTVATTYTNSTTGEKYAYVTYKTYTYRVDLTKEGVGELIASDTSIAYGYFDEGAAKGDTSARLFLDGKGNATLYAYVTVSYYGYSFKLPYVCATGTYTVDDNGYYTLNLTQYYAYGSYTADEAEENLDSYYNGVKIKLETVTTSSGTTTTFATADKTEGMTLTASQGTDDEKVIFQFVLDGFGYAAVSYKEASATEYTASGTYSYSYIDELAYTNGGNSYKVLYLGGLYLRLATGSSEADIIYILSDFGNRLSEDDIVMLFAENGTIDFLTENEEGTAYAYTASGTYTADSSTYVYTFTSTTDGFKNFAFKVSSSLGVFLAYKENEILTITDSDGTVRTLTDGYGIFNSRYYYVLKDGWISVYSYSSTSGLSLGATYKVSGTQIVLPDDYAATYYSYELDEEGNIQFGVTGIVLDGYGTATYKTTDGDTAGTYTVNEDGTISATFGEKVITFKPGLRMASSTTYNVYILANEAWKTTYACGDTTYTVNEYGETTYTVTSTSGTTTDYRAYLVISDDTLIEGRKIAYMYCYLDSATSISGYVRFVLTEESGVKTLTQFTGTYRAYYLYQDSRMSSTIMLKYDGLGNVYYVTESATIKGTATATENEGEYTFTSEDENTTFVYKLSSISSGSSSSTTYYVFMTYSKTYDAAFVAGDWKTLTLDGYGNATLVSVYGVKTTMLYREVNDTVIFLYSSSSTTTYYFTMNTENHTFAATSEAFITDGGTLLAYTGTDSEVTLPSTVTAIAHDAFYLNTTLKIVHLSNVTTIGDYAFAYCVNLTTIDLGKVTTIGANAFAYTALTAVDLSSATSIGVYAFRYNTALTAVALPSTLTEIAGGAFYGCTSLASVTGLENVTAIGAYAFYYCSALTEVTLGETLESIGAYAFAYCGTAEGKTFSLTLTGETAPTIGANVLSRSGNSGAWIFVKNMTVLKAYLGNVSKLGTSYQYLAVKGDAHGIYVDDEISTTQTFSMAANSRAFLTLKADGSTTTYIFFYEVGADGVTITLYSYSSTAGNGYVTYTATISGNVLTMTIGETEYRLTLSEDAEYDNV